MWQPSTWRNAERVWLDCESGEHPESDANSVEIVDELAALAARPIELALVDGLVPVAVKLVMQIVGSTEASHAAASIAAVGGEELNANEILYLHQQARLLRGAMHREESRPGT